MNKYIMSFSCDRENEIEFHNIQTFHSYFLLFSHPTLFLPPLSILKLQKSIFNFLLFFFCPFYLFCYKFLPSRKTCAIIIISFRVNEISMHIFHGIFCFYLMNFGVDFFLWIFRFQHHFNGSFVYRGFHKDHHFMYQKLWIFVG